MKALARRFRQAKAQRVKAAKHRQHEARFAEAGAPYGRGFAGTAEWNDIIPNAQGFIEETRGRERQARQDLARGAYGTSYATDASGAADNALAEGRSRARRELAKSATGTSYATDADSAAARVVAGREAAKKAEARKRAEHESDLRIVRGVLDGDTKMTKRFNAAAGKKKETLRRLMEEERAKREQAAREERTGAAKYFETTAEREDGKRPRETRTVAVADLLTSEPRLDEGKLARGRKNMDAAASGTGPRRKPLTVYERADGKLVVLDGNTTLGILKERGETEALVEVVNSIKQPHDNLDDIYADAKKAKPILEKQARAFAKKTGGTLVTRKKGDGLKIRERAEDKVKDYGTAASCTDILAVTLVYDTPAELHEALKQFEAEFAPVEMKNRFDKKTSSGYRDILTRVRVIEANGHVAEIQLTTKAMHTAKEDAGHKLYEAERELIEDIKKTGDRKFAELKDAIVAFSKEYYDAAARVDAAGNYASSSALSSAISNALSRVISSQSASGLQSMVDATLELTSTNLSTSTRKALTELAAIIKGTPSNAKYRSSSENVRNIESPPSDASDTESITGEAGESKEEERGEA